MPAKNKNTIPDTVHSDTALLIIDVIADFNFEDGDAILKQATEMTPSLVKLKRKARAAKVPVIYINDNFGKWQEDFQTTLRHCLRPASRGKELVARLRPTKNDYYILKPQRSAFYQTTLELLLAQLGVQRLIITGLTTDICIFFSANDAYMRNYSIVVPRDCVCALSTEINENSLKTIERIMSADIHLSTEIALKGPKS